MSFYHLLFIVIISIFLILIVLLQIDLRIDYSNRDISYYFYADNGFYISVPYFIWQINKRKAIEQLFSEQINYEGKTYVVTAIFKDKPHIKGRADFLPYFLYRDYIATVELGTISKNTITNINQVVGNNNTINNISIISTQHIYNIISNIDVLLNSDINDIDKQYLELFKIKLYQNNIDEDDKNRVILVLERLTKYAPYASLASSIINLIKSFLS